MECPPCFHRARLLRSKSSGDPPELLPRSITSITPQLVASRLHLGGTVSCVWAEPSADITQSWFAGVRWKTIAAPPRGPCGRQVVCAIESELRDVAGCDFHDADFEGHERAAGHRLLQVLEQSPRLPMRFSYSWAWGSSLLRATVNSAAAAYRYDCGPGVHK